MTVSISDLARMANTSMATVSRALSGKPGVSKERRTSIRLLAERVGYRPNQVARSLVAKRTNTIGFVTANLSNQAHVGLLQLLEADARDRGYEMLVADSRLDVKREQTNIEALQRHRVDGLIVLPVWELDRHTDQRHLLALQTQGVPLVVNCDMEEYGVTTAASDERLAGHQVAESILQRGHRHLLVIGCADANQLSRTRLAGIMDAVRDRRLGQGSRDLPPTVRELGFDLGKDPTAMSEELRKILGSPTRPTAAIALYSHLALHLLRPLHQLGVRVPHDLSLVVFDDSDWCRHGVPAMTAVASRKKRLAQEILNELEHRIRSPEAAPSRRRVPQRIIHRESLKTVE